MKVFALALALLALPLVVQPQGAPKVKATQHSVTANFTQSVVPATINGGPYTCPNGSNQTQITVNSLYRSTTSGGEGAIGGTPAPLPLQVSTAPVTQFIDLAVSPGVTYFYKVTATNCGGESQMSGESPAATIPNSAAPAPPGTPTLGTVAVLTGPGGTVHSALIQWKPSATANARYVIQRDDAGLLDYKPLTVSPVACSANPCEYLDTTLAKGKTYNWQIASWSAPGVQGPWSAKLQNPTPIP